MSEKEFGQVANQIVGQVEGRMILLDMLRDFARYAKHRRVSVTLTPNGFHLSKGKKSELVPWGGATNAILRRALGRVASVVGE